MLTRPKPSNIHVCKALPARSIIEKILMCTSSNDFIAKCQVLDNNNNNRLSGQKNILVRRKMHCLVLLFKIFHTSTPSYLVSRFHLLSSNHNLNTRSYHNSLLNIRHHRTSLYSTSFSVSAARDWNSLPQEIRGCQTLVSFKRNLILSLL